MTLIAFRRASRRTRRWLAWRRDDRAWKRDEQRLGRLMRVIDEQAKAGAPTEAEVRAASLLDELTVAMAPTEAELRIARLAGELAVTAYEISELRVYVPADWTTV